MLAIRVKVRVGLRLGLGKSLFPVGRAKDQRLPAGPIAIAKTEGTRGFSFHLVQPRQNWIQVIAS